MLAAAEAAGPRGIARTTTRDLDPATAPALAAAILAEDMAPRSLPEPR